MDLVTKQHAPFMDLVTKWLSTATVLSVLSQVSLESISEQRLVRRKLEEYEARSVWTSGHLY